MRIEQKKMLKSGPTRARGRLGKEGMKARMSSCGEYNRKKQSCREKKLRYWI